MATRPTRYRALAAALLAVAGTALAGCSSDPPLPARTMVITGKEMVFDAPDHEKPGSYTITFANVGTTTHELAVKNSDGDFLARASAAAGQTITLTAELKPGTYELECHEPGHFQAGMKRTLVIDKS